ncbi:hypothetical protein [Rhodococcus sp. NPDC049939]|uniref:hypothetical protein n=1 Tax=Rhodococcus sp. NPDC049939 TaxID=3155511 RepID=UPI0033FA0BEB
MNRLTARSTIALLAAAPLTLFGAGTAVAAPEDVDVAASVDGDTVVTTITNNTGADVYCMVIGTKQGDGKEKGKWDQDFGMGRFNNGVGWETVPVASGTQTYSYSDLPAGEYVVSWGCIDQPEQASAEEVWGTEPWFMVPTADALTVEVSPQSTSGSSIFGS